MQRLFILENFVIYLYVPGCPLLFHNTIQLLIFCKTMQRLFLCKTIQCLFFRAKGCTLLFWKTMQGLFFFPKLWTVFFLAKGGCLPLCRSMQGVSFVKTVKCFFVAKGIFVCKTMLFKIKEWSFFLRKRGNLLLCITVHCLPSTLRKVYSVFSTVFLLLLLLAVAVGCPAACFGR